MRILIVCFLVLSARFAVAASTVDVVVVGGTPAGVAAAVTAARRGHSVALIEDHAHLGGMAASGLGKSDVERRRAIGGLFLEFTARVYRHYVSKYGKDSKDTRLCKNGYYYEPSVAEAIFDQLVAEEPRISVYRFHRLETVTRQGRRVVAVRVRNRSTGAAEEFRAAVFVDATYEGDLAAFAGAACRLGRESRTEFNELHAGVVYQDYQTRRFLPGTTGEGDRRLPAYTFRLCLSTDPANSHVLSEAPPAYDRSRYLGYLDDWKAGRLDAPKEFKPGRGYFAPTFGTVVRALSITELPNGKTDVNMNPRPLGFPFAAENYDYPEADWPEREKITERIRNLTLGLLYFLQNDPAVPKEHRALANRYHLARDEFVDTGNFPWQIYIREARRIIGLYTLTENDLIVGPGLGRTRIHSDSIAAGEFPIDSFPVRKREPGHDTALEGYILMLDEYTRPYQIPYRILVPQEVDALLVPVAASTTHIAFSTIRTEPTWMILGQAAGVAAHLAIVSGRQPRDVDVERLQRLLLADGQVVTYFEDLKRDDEAYEAVQFFGTRGFFDDEQARTREPLSRDEASRWLRLAGAGVAPKSWRGPQSLTRGDLGEFLGGEVTVWSYRGAARRDEDAILRGEFCRTIYDLAPSTSARKINAEGAEAQRRAEKKEKRR